jgi:hypothetical protein
MPRIDKDAERLAERQLQAAKAVYEQQGLKGIFRLADAVVLPESVGCAVAKIPLAESEETEFLQRGFSRAPGDYAKNPLLKAARSYAWSKYDLEGEAWLDSVLARPDIEWTPSAHANLALGILPSVRLWQRLEDWGEETDTLYWKNVWIYGEHEHWLRIIAKWKEVGRPLSSMALLTQLVGEQHASGAAARPSAEQVADVLEQALGVSANSESSEQPTAMTSYYAEQLFLFLDSQKVAPGKMAELEWGWLRVLEDTKRGAKFLQEQVTSSPNLFVDVLKALFRAEGEPPSKNVPEERARIAEQAFHLLRDIHTLPGSRAGKDSAIVIDAGFLREWVLGARKLAAEAKRLNVCDSQVGQILSYAPKSPDGSWPCVEVRDLIEDIKSPRLELGLRIGKLNQRGVIFRGKGGDQERALAKEYREFADKVRNGWPRTASILDGLAKGYEEEAGHWDAAAKREQYE